MLIGKERVGISRNDQFIYSGDFENGKKHGHGEMYWAPIDLEVFESLPMPELIDGLTIFQPGHY
jgi:hypothetical protein